MRQQQPCREQIRRGNARRKTHPSPPCTAAHPCASKAYRADTPSHIPSGTPSALPQRERSASIPQEHASERSRAADITDDRCTGKCGNPDAGDAPRRHSAPPRDPALRPAPETARRASAPVRVRARRANPAGTAARSRASAGAPPTNSLCR